MNNYKSIIGQLNQLESCALNEESRTCTTPQKNVNHSVRMQSLLENLFWKHSFANYQLLHTEKANPV